MISTGRPSERIARIHYALVCLDRMAKFTGDRAHDWLKSDMAARLQSISSDAVSLVHFSEGLVSRVQLLQDAAVGIISSDQNDVIKVLTIASVVGIPPVLIAGIYGMNFKNIHEYDCAGGLAVGLGAHCDLGAAAADLVQTEELDLSFFRDGALRALHGDGISRRSSHNCGQ